MDDSKTSTHQKLEVNKNEIDNQKKKVDQKQQPKCKQKKATCDYSEASRKRKKNYAVSITESTSQERNDKKYCSYAPKCTGEISNDMNTWFCCFATKIGGMFSLFEKNDGTPIIIAGPSWPVCIFFTFPIILIGSFLITWAILLDTGLVSVVSIRKKTKSCHQFY